MQHDGHAEQDLQQQAEAAADDGLLERDVLLDDGRVLHVAESQAENEAGATVWDCGLVLAHYLLKQHELGALDLANLRVIELGAGTGVVGLTAAALGAKQAVLTDRPGLVPHLQRNIQRNRLQGSTRAAALEWEQPLPPDLLPPFDLVLCSDVVYSRASVRPLLSTIRELTGPASEVLYACEFREGAGLELVHELLPEYGFKEQLVPYTDLHEDWHSPDILVWRIRAAGPDGAATATAPNGKA